MFDITVILYDVKIIFLRCLNLVLFMFHREVVCLSAGKAILNKRLEDGNTKCGKTAKRSNATAKHSEFNKSGNYSNIFQILKSHGLNF